jgi:hypothetical protein
VGDRGVVDVNSVFLAKIPKGRDSEGFAQVSDDPVGYTETVCNVFDKLCHFFRCYFRNRLDFNPLGKFINGYQYVFVAAWGGIVTTPSKIIPYYHLNHSIWSLSNNKESSN